MGKLELLRPNWPAPDNIFATVTTRGGGCSTGAYASLNMAMHVGDEEIRVQRNREIVAAELDLKADFQWLRQVHGNKSAIVHAAGAELEADGLYTRAPGIVLCVLTADCLPIFACSRTGDEAGLIHAGWRGMSAGIIENTLAAMRTSPADLLIWLGPAILACHYEVGEDVRKAFLDIAATPAQRESLARAFQPADAAGKFHADLARIAEIKLQAIGVASISGGTLCAHCDAQRFFSHRRDRVCGRMANMIGIRPPG